MSEFKVVVRMQIHSCMASVSSDDVWLERRLMLPFPPYVGLNISSGEWECEISEVYWDCDKKQFKCYTAPDTTLYDAALRPSPDTPKLETIVKEYLESGWKRERATS